MLKPLWKVCYECCELCVSHYSSDTLHKYILEVADVLNAHCSLESIPNFLVYLFAHFRLSTLYMGITPTFKSEITCLYAAGGLFHVEVEMRVQSKDTLEGQYFTTIGTQGMLPGFSTDPIVCISVGGPWWQEAVVCRQSHSLL